MKNVKQKCAQTLSILLLSALSLSANATTFTLAPIRMDVGYVISGTIDTDGTLGFLTSANFVKWSIVVTQSTDKVFTETNTTAANISQVATNGKKIFVPASIDGFTDGGSLNFTGRAPLGGIPPSALVADFTGQNVVGGVAGWQTPIALNFVSLNEPNGATYVAASAIRNKVNQFRITTVVVSTTPTVMTLFGTVTTDGALGGLTPANFKSWRIIGREEDSQKYTEQNSQILDAVQVYTDGQKLEVYNDGSGVLSIGTPFRPGVRGTTVRIADFTDAGFPGGFAAYDYGIFGRVALKWPLTHNRIYAVAVNRKGMPFPGVGPYDAERAD